MLFSEKMQLADVFGGLGRSRFDELLKKISIGSLRTYQVYESFKIHARLSKVNRERLRKAAPKLWERLQHGDEVLARELAHAILICHLPMVVEVLDFLEIAHDGNGFFDKDRAAKQQLQTGWQKRVFDEFRDKYPVPLLLLYINHLDREVGAPAEPFLGAEAGVAANG